MKVRIIKMGPQGMTKTITQSPLGCSSNMCGKSLSEQDQHRMKTTVWRGHTSLMHMRWQTSTPDWLDRFLFVKRYTMIQQCGYWHLIRVLNWSFNFDFLCVKLCRKKAYFPYFYGGFLWSSAEQTFGKMESFCFWFFFQQQGTLTEENSRRGVDREFFLLFATFDENRSWYLDDNINDYCSDPGPIDELKSDPGFQLSNQNYAINGFLYGNLQGLEMYKGEKVEWYLMGLGDLTDVHTVHFHGQTFLYVRHSNNTYGLYPWRLSHQSFFIAWVGLWSGGGGFEDFGGIA